MAKVEQGIGELQPWIRDHVVHALLTFTLGSYLGAKYITLNNSDVNILQWKLAGLFHDIGYPIQTAKDLMKPMLNKVNGIKKELVTYVLSKSNKI